jgi:hypothetical protein
MHGHMNSLLAAERNVIRMMVPGARIHALGTSGGGGSSAIVFGLATDPAGSGSSLWSP